MDIINNDVQWVKQTYHNIKKLRYDIYMLKKISFRSDGGRSGNNIIQYMTCIRIGLKSHHHYVPFQELSEYEIKEGVYINDDNIQKLLNDLEYDGENSVIDEVAGAIAKATNLCPETKSMDIASATVIICDGYFQNDAFFLPYRKQIMEKMYDPLNHDYWFNHGVSNDKIYIRSFLDSTHWYDISEKDIVVSLRLDDFLQYEFRDSRNSNVVPYSFYEESLSKLMKCRNASETKIFIVIDKIKQIWEMKYIEQFKKWEPFIFQNDIFTDCAIFRTAPLLIHSNSTLCWIMSFLSKNENMIRIIPNTYYYPKQFLGIINERTDTIIDVNPPSQEELLLS